MVHLQTSNDALRYEALIKSGAEESFDIALYHPVPRQQFDIGTVFTRPGNGTITKYVGAPYDMVPLHKFSR